MKKLILGVVYNLAVLGAIVTGFVLTENYWFAVLLIFMNKNLLKIREV